jgi:hypothetical protein
LQEYTRRNKIPRLSLYRPEKGNDFKFIDRAINEQFQIGGTDVFVHKYLGPVNPEQGQSTPGVPSNTNPVTELGIQDLIFLENRDRHYDSNIYTLRGIYTIQDIDFNLTQFGLFLTNDNIMITFHLRSTFDAIGRKLMPGDVLELPHLKDEYALDDAMVALRRFYVITDVSRAATGFSQTWYPHLLRAKCEPLIDSQEFKEILDSPSGDGNKTLRDMLSTYNTSIEINKAIIAQAEADVKLSGYETDHLFTIPLNSDGTVRYADASISDISVDSNGLDASSTLSNPAKNLYVGYLTDNGIPANGAPYSFGIEFPNNASNGQFHLRTDYFPNRLFRYNGRNWEKYEDNVRMTMTNLGVEQVSSSYTGQSPRLNQKGTFVNNNNTATIAGIIVPEKQALSKALKPKADN